jgi:hypothetical protein
MSEATPAVTSEVPPAAASVAPPAGLPVAIKSWNEVNQPGSYICTDTGRLLRVPASGLTQGNVPIIEFLGPQGPANVKRLSEDPSLPIADLRLLATAASIKPQF